jgi:hypothetical protein
MLSTIAFSKFTSASFLAVLLSPASLPSELSSNAAPPVPVLEVIKVYGRLASASCFGKTAPPGSSCQVTSDEMKDKLGLTDSSTILNRDEFGKRLSSLSFQWPLKPYGVDKGLEKDGHDEQRSRNKRLYGRAGSQGSVRPTQPNRSAANKLEVETERTIARGESRS